MYSVLVAAMALHARAVHNLDNSSGIVDRLLPTEKADTVWTVPCDGIFAVQYLNDFGGDFIIRNNGKEESRVSGEHSTVTTHSFVAQTRVIMIARVTSLSGNKKVLFSWACDAMPAALPSTLNTAGDVSHMNYGPDERKYWVLPCKEDEEVNIKWTSFNVGNDSLRIGQRKNRVSSTFFNASGLDTAEDFTFTSTGATYVFFISDAGSAGGDFAFRYECLLNDIVLPNSGIVDRLLPSKIADTVWTVPCDGIFAVQYLNDFGGDFIISNNGKEESRVSGGYHRLTTHTFAARTAVTMTASMKTGNKKVLFSWACDAVPAALPSTLNTAGDVSHLNYGPDDREYWILQCKEDQEVNIKWTSFNIGNDSLRMMRKVNGFRTTFFNASGLDTVEDFTFTSTGPTYVFFTTDADSVGGDFAFRYECLSNNIVLPNSGIVDRLLPNKIADTVWTVPCDGIFAVQYLNDFGGDFIISINGKEESRVSGEHNRVITKNFATHTAVTMTASMKTGNKKVLFSWACDAMPAALPSTLNTAGDVSHLNYGPDREYWILQCKEDQEVNIKWTSFNIGNDSLRMMRKVNGFRTTFFNASGLDTAEDFTFTSTGPTYVFFTTDADSVGGDFAFRYECLSNNIVLPNSGIVDRLLPNKIADTVWTVPCDGIFAVQYLNDFGGDFIISINGKEESRVSGEHNRVITKHFATRTAVTMTASTKTGNKKVLFSWACDAVPAALPSTPNTAGDVSHLNYGPDSQEHWILQCDAAMRITWTSFNIGNDSLRMMRKVNGFRTTFFNASGLDTVEDFTFTSTGATYVFFTTDADSDGGDFAFRYECLSAPAPPTAEPSAVPTATPTTAPTALPTAVPTATPTAEPTTAPTALPTALPIGDTAGPTAEPTALPTAEPTAPPTALPIGDTAEPTALPTALPEGHTPVPTTEAPSSAAMTWCTSDAQCKQHGDTAATCKDNGHCMCGDGFVKPFDAASGRRAHICVTSETRVSDVVHATFDVACDGSSGKGASVGQLVVDLVGGTVTDVREECGSLNVFVSVSDMPLLDVAAMDVAARLSEKVQASDLGLGDVLSAGLASVDALQCPTVPGVRQVYRTDAGVCVPLSCLSGYTRVGSADHFVCSTKADKATPLPTTPLQEETPEPDTGADALAVGGIIGVCLGGITAVAIVVLAFVVCTLKKVKHPSTNAPNFRSSNSAL